MYLRVETGKHWKVCNYMHESFTYEDLTTLNFFLSCACSKLDKIGSVFLLRGRFYIPAVYRPLLGRTDLCVCVCRFKGRAICAKILSKWGW